jgi:hypothetical protein
VDTPREAHLLEYEKLKEEQGRRIHFRDNMRYVTLAAIGVVASQAGGSTPEFWLAIPWICLVLGWNYVANADAVKQIGNYIEGTLSEAVSVSAGGTPVFLWERLRHEDERYAARRVRQLVVDEITFFFPGVIALVIFGLTNRESILLWPLAGIEALLCLWIGRQIYRCAGERGTARLKDIPSALAGALLERRRGVILAS